MKHLRALVRLEKHLAESVLHVADVRRALATEPRVKETQQFLDGVASKLAIIGAGVATVQKATSEKPEQGTLFTQPVEMADAEEAEYEEDTADVA